MKRTFIGVGVILIAIMAAIALNIGNPKPCTGNVMQDNLMKCGLNIGDVK